MRAGAGQGLEDKRPSSVFLLCRISVAWVEVRSAPGGIPRSSEAQTLTVPNGMDEGPALCLSPFSLLRYLSSREGAPRMSLAAVVVLGSES